jgi:hypothetical protein
LQKPLFVGGCPLDCSIRDLMKWLSLIVFPKDESGTIPIALHPVVAIVRRRLTPLAATAVALAHKVFYHVMVTNTEPVWIPLIVSSSNFRALYALHFVLEMDSANAINA